MTRRSPSAARFVRRQVIAVVNAGRKSNRQDAALEKRAGIGTRVEELAVGAIVRAVELQSQVLVVDAVQEYGSLSTQHLRPDDEDFVALGDAG